MDQDQITRWTRRGIREPLPVTVMDADIENMTLEAIYYFGTKIKELDPSFFNERKAISSSTHIFSKPSDLLTLLRVWDLETTAGTITAASNASPIVITCTDHGFADDAIVQIQDVAGNTAANGIWLTTLVDDDNFSLDGSTGNAAYTSGGLCLEVSENLQKIEKIQLKESTMNNDDAWFPRGDYIVIDDDDFTNDILIDYIKRPTAVADIPVEYHMGLVAFNVIHLMTIPPETDPNFNHLASSLNTHKKLLATVEDSLLRTFRVSTEPIRFVEELYLDNEVECA